MSSTSSQSCSQVFERVFTPGEVVVSAHETEHGDHLVQSENTPEEIYFSRPSFLNHWDQEHGLFSSKVHTIRNKVSAKISLKCYIPAHFFMFEQCLLPIW